MDSAPLSSHKSSRTVAQKSVYLSGNPPLTMPQHEFVRDSSSATFLHTRCPLIQTPHQNIPRWHRASPFCYSLARGKYPAPADATRRDTRSREVHKCPTKLTNSKNAPKKPRTNPASLPLL